MTALRTAQFEKKYPFLTFFVQASVPGWLATPPPPLHPPPHPPPRDTTMENIFRLIFSLYREYVCLLE